MKDKMEQTVELFDIVAQPTSAAKYANCTGVLVTSIDELKHELLGVRPVFTYKIRENRDYRQKLTINDISERTIRIGRVKMNMYNLGMKIKLDDFPFIPPYTNHSDWIYTHGINRQVHGELVNTILRRWKAQVTNNDKLTVEKEWLALL